MTLCAECIAARLDALGASRDRPLTVAAVTGSTNDDARRAAAAGAPQGAVFVADQQTAGRGRGGRAWHSPPGRGLYLSLVLRPQIGAALVPPLALAVGVGVARLADAVLGAGRAAIKWPNDVLVGERKLAGILIEATSVAERAAVLVVGVGLNVRGRDLPREIADVATTLELAGAGTLDRSVLCAELIVALETACDDYARGGLGPVHDELVRRDLLRGRWVRIDALEGMAMGIDARGRLQVRDDRGVVHALVSGEVCWHRSVPPGASSHALRAST